MEEVWFWEEGSWSLVVGTLGPEEADIVDGVDESSCLGFAERDGEDLM